MMARSGVLPHGFLRFTSQTKPGPNIASAEAKNVRRKDSKDENELFIWVAKDSGIGRGCGDCDKESELT